MRRRRCCLRSCSVAASAFAQGQHPISGRKYAGVMGAAGADWLVRPERAEEEQPDKAIALLGIAKGATVADIGAGNGYMTWRLAERVGPTGKVFANDIQPEMLEMLRKNMQQRKLKNVETVLGTYRRSQAAGERARPRHPGGCLSRVLRAAEDAAPDSRIAKARRAPGAAGISRRGSRGADPAGAQDDRGAGEDRTRARRLPRGPCAGRPAAAAHSDLPKKLLDLSTTSGLRLKEERCH